jgi:hypothetical protein
MLPFYLYLCDMISVDTSSVHSLSETLTKIHRAAFPNAVRTALNDAAFDVKKNTLLISAKENFDNVRQPNLFKKYSAVLKAEGWVVEKMQSTVGMSPSGAASKTIDRFEEQEEGGSLEHKAIPLNLARVGGLHKGKVLKNRFTGNVTKIATVAYGDKKALIRTVTGFGRQRGGKGKGVAVLYGNILYEIKGFKRFRRTNSIKLHFDQIYKYNKSRKVSVKPTHFVKEAGLSSGKNIPQYFVKSAEKQFAKFMNR